jgi:crotonobetainyl-CoA:carnitine CoA-transferase CaiB-like acyl-CoA transferase
VAGALSHLRVLDLSRVLAGPWCGQILADLGADVIKIERPGSGDDTRSWGPPYLKDRLGRATSEAAYYLCANRGKKSLTLNIATPEGQAIARSLATQCDVLIENYKVDTLAKYGLAYADLRAINPRLVYCSITGFGQTGPYRERAGYDYIVQGMGGLMSITGEADGAPGGGPQKVGVAVADLSTGLYATIGILAAIQHRERSGEGQHVDLGLLDVQVAMLANIGQNFLATGVVPRRLGNAHASIVPYNVFETRDGHIILAVGNDQQFATFCRLAQRPELAQDARFRSNSERVGNRAALMPLLAEIMATRTSAEWLALLESEGVPAGPINTLDQVYADPQVQARGMVADVPHPLAGRARLTGSPLKLSATPPDLAAPPPTLGQHTREVLRELLHMSEADIDRLAQRKII